MPKGTTTDDGQAEDHDGGDEQESSKHEQQTSVVGDTAEDTAAPADDADDGVEDAAATGQDVAGDGADSDIEDLDDKIMAEEDDLPAEAATNKQKVEISGAGSAVDSNVSDPTVIESSKEKDAPENPHEVELGSKEAAEAEKIQGKRVNDQAGSGETSDPNSELVIEKESKDKEDAKEKGGGAGAPTGKSILNLNIVRGPHAKVDTDLNKLRGSNSAARDKTKGEEDTSKAGKAKDRTKGSSAFDDEHGDSPHVRFPSPPQQQHLSEPSSSSSSSSSNMSSHSHSRHCNFFSLQCHAKETFSAHPLTSSFVVAMFVLLLSRRWHHRNNNNSQARMDGRGEYAAIELLEGNFDDEMSFTGDGDVDDDDDPNDIVASWRGSRGDRFKFVASGVGDDLDDAVSDEKISLQEMNG